MSQPDVSVIVPACNCQKTVAQTIRAVLAQDAGRPFELIIVDDGSTDRTADEAKNFFHDQRLRYFFQSNAGPSAARNRGAREARGDVLFFTDSDCVPPSTWIRGMLPYLDRGPGSKEEGPPTAVVCGSYGIANPDQPLAAGIHQEILYRHHCLMPEYPRFFGSYNFCILRDVFERVGGFDTGYRRASGEDNDLSYKILASGCRIYFAKNSIVNHYHASRLGRYLREQFRHGFWRVKMYRDHPAMRTGDGYTFWKDILEIPVAGLLFLSAGAALYAPDFFLKPLALSLPGLLAFETGFAFLMTGTALPSGSSLPLCRSWGGKIRQGFFWGWVMFLRSFARASGFAAGLFFMEKKSRK